MVPAITATRTAATPHIKEFICERRSNHIWAKPQDLMDLRALFRVASSGELTRARSALALIAARGYHRDRDLSSEMNTLLPLVP